VTYRSERGIQMEKRFRGTSKVLLIAAVTAIAIAVAASVAAARPSAAKACTKSNPITLGQPGLPPVFLGVRAYTADKQGFYSKYCADVTIKQFTTGTDALRAVQSGQIDAAWAPTPTAMAAIAKTQDLVAIEGMDVVDWEVGSIDSSIKTCADLKGQTIGVDTVGGARYLALDGMLHKCNLSLSDVKTVNFPGAAAMQAMIAGSLKVSVLHIDEEAQIDKLRSQDVTILAKLTDVDPFQHYDMLVVQKASIKNHYYDYLKMLAADIATTRYMYDPKNLDTVAQIGTITGVSQDIAKGAVSKYIKMKWWPKDNPGLGQSRITRTIGLNVKLGNLPNGQVTWKSLVDTRMWKAAYKLVTGKKYVASPTKAG
jgi:NitT/TauT family transport system substrate-binding protein